MLKLANLDDITSTDSGEGADAFARWIEDGPSPVMRLYDISGDLDGFYARRSVLGLQKAAIARIDYSSLTYLRTADHVRADLVDSIAVQTNAKGSLRGLYGDVAVEVDTPSATFIDWSKTGRHESTAIEGFTLTLPRDLFRPAELDGVHGVSISGAPYSLLSDYAAWLMQPSPALELGPGARSDAAVGAVVSACLARHRIEAAARDILGGLALHRAQRFIHAHCAHPGLGVTAIASAACVSRATLYRLFTPFGGVAEFVWTARLERALWMLNHPSRQGTIAAIAHECGFVSQSHFSRRFTERFGFRPTNLRPF